MLKIANESPAQVRMFNSTNASSNKPTLVVTYRPAIMVVVAQVFTELWAVDQFQIALGYAVGSHSYMDISVIN